MSKSIYQDLFKAYVLKAQDFHRTRFKEYSEYSGKFEIDKIKDSFGKALKEYIENETGVTNPINHRTLINILNGGIAPNARNATLDVVAQFVGYGNFKDFTTMSSTETFRKRKVLPILLIGLSILVFGIVSYVYFRREEHRKTNHDFSEIIKAANSAQFEAYKALPEIKTDKLKEFYTDNGSAFKVIEDILKRSSSLNRSIIEPRGNPSYYTIHNTKIIKKEKELVVIETQEHWYLRWYNTKLKVYEKKYDVTNSQIYIFKKVKEAWKIDSNDYEGNAENIE